MRLKSGFAKTTAIMGTALVFLPLMAPVGLGFASLLAYGKFLLDWLMPGELFLVVLSGGILLLVSSILARCHRVFIIAAFGAVLIFFLATISLADITGLASGRGGGNDWRMVVVSACFAAYALSAALLGAGGIALIRRLFRRNPV